MFSALICRHFLGLPCTRRNLALASEFHSRLWVAVFCFLVGLICWPLLYPIVVMWMSL